MIFNMGKVTRSGSHYPVFSCRGETGLMCVCVDRHEDGDRIHNRTAGPTAEITESSSGGIKMRFNLGSGGSRGSSPAGSGGRRSGDGKWLVYTLVAAC